MERGAREKEEGYLRAKFEREQSKAEEEKRAEEQEKE